ncbi:translocation and assembly module lipoprotein TamL [Flavobacterium silvaticum]|uniref:BamA/TamA family outer membrane protein n=1 Tax=Flavobacterium silvaticum TaxID=1852020 RepID=A0A972JHQ1_9FLAO|nr:BamA/TamA family outer membrane protein [Flavobacterium silvaticum]NMH27373.1 BamA/TamA family outer membrane protein [Flavobacterium silvaticum]
MTPRIKIFLLFGFVLTLWACSNTKYLPEGELLYTGASVRVKDSTMPKKERKALEARLEELLRPKPNKKFLGLRPKLYIYNLAGKPKKEKGLRSWLRNKVGEPPVLFSQVKLDYNADLIQNNAQNLGYFKAMASADSTRSGKKATADYTIEPGPRYYIKSVTFPSDSTALDSTIASYGSESLLKVGAGYDLDIIKSERSRIDARLKEKGYYFFGPDYLKVQVDSTVGKHEVDMIVRVKNETPESARKIYKINDIFIYPSFTVRKDTVGIDSTDVTYYRDFVIIDKQKLFKPRIFDRTLYFEKGDLYNRTAHNLSLNRLISLGVFKFVKNEFRVVDDEEGDKLDAFYYLTPLTKKSIRTEVLAKTNSANYAGTELNVNWSHRNAFKGAELLQVSAFGGLEVQFSGQNKGYNIYRVGSDVSLTWPRFLTPFTIESSSGFVPKTKASIGYEYQLRSQLYSLNNFKASFGYSWKENIRKEHQYNVTEITYVNPGFVTDEYQQRIEADSTGTLKRVVEKQLIFGPTYSYTYTNTMQAEKRNTIYFKAGLDVAGTIAGLATGANVRDGNEKSVFGVPFSQYVKLEAEFRHYLRLGKNSKLASRLLTGYGYAYGNSKEMPYIKQFFIGGTNSIRAFRARSLGPGTFREDTDPNDFLADQSGDIKLELNTELRTKIYSVVDGALFVDAGNIWLRQKNPDKPGAEFSSDFLNELAVGTGAGIRVDLSFLILRLDLAFPIRKPWLPDGSRWVIDQVSFGDSSWRKENLIFNLAIGYPF